MKINFTQQWVSVYLYVLFYLCMSLYYKVSIRKKPLKQTFTKSITYGLLNIKQSQDSGYIYIVFTFKQPDFEIAQAIFLFLF